MRSIPESPRQTRARRLQDALSNARDLFAVVTQGLTVLRIAALVLVLYVKFKLEHLIDRHQD